MTSWAPKIELLTSHGKHKLRPLPIRQARLSFIKDNMYYINCMIYCILNSACKEIMY